MKILTSVGLRLGFGAVLGEVFGRVAAVQKDLRKVITTQTSILATGALAT